MDPTQCLAELLEAFHEGERDTALERLEDLQTWLKRNGAMPDVGDAIDITGLIDGDF